MSVEAKTSKPKGPTPVLVDKPIRLHISCGFLQLHSKISALSTLGTVKEISTSA